MSAQHVPLDYVNSLSFELQKAFWDERGRGARFRMTTVGREYFRERVLPRIQSTDLGEIAATVEQALQESGIAARVTHVFDDRLIRLRIEGCLHLGVEEKMAAHGVEPFTCVPANILVLALEEKLKRPVELAEIKLVDGHCEPLLVLFDKRPDLE